MKRATPEQDARGARAHVGRDVDPSVRAPVEVVSEHRCRIRHQSAAAFVRCAYPGAVSVTGSGVFALLSCSPLGISLWPTLARAREEQGALDAAGCSPSCRGEHEVIAIDYDDEP